MKRSRIGVLDASSIGLGCMNLSFGYGPADDEESVALLNAALDAGVDFLDTAMMYGDGHNERLIGRALAGRREEFVLASKCGLSAAGIDGDPGRVRGDCEASLARLGTDVIDLYYLHRVDPKVPVEETVGAMGRLVEAGLVREIGLSEVSTETLRRAHAAHPVAALQSEYSLWSRTPEFGALDACRELGIAFVPFSPLGRGFLAGSARDVDALAADDLRATIARPRFEPAACAANARLLEALRARAEARGCTSGQLALAWLLGRDGLEVVPIPGTRDREHLLENAAAAAIAPLEGSERAALDELFDESAVSGTRYTPERMAGADAERDRLRDRGPRN